MNKVGHLELVLYVLGSLPGFVEQVAMLEGEGLSALA
jgi:hypothetical protein